MAYYKPLNLMDYYKSSIFWFFVPLTWSVLYLGLKFWIDLIESKIRGEKYLLLSQRTQLQMLRYQLNPHFLFNSLSSIQALVYDDPSQADRMITQLSDFLRYTIRDKDKLFISLKEEVVIVEKYLSIEKTRFPDRLNYKINVSKVASEQEVLAFILQPFVENAVKYGMKSSPDFLNVLINGFYRDKTLILEVVNNGEWIESDTEGTGIKNVFERLENAYPEKYKLNIDCVDNTVRVRIEIDIEK
jgi:LytS/YehU family sensor histidine kinase